MDIQVYIVDYWMTKMSVKHPLLVIYDPTELYHSLLPIAEEKGIKVIDTTKDSLNTRIEACDFWSKKLGYESDARMIIYRACKRPSGKNEEITEPYAAFAKGGVCFPVGPVDEYVNLCKAFLPTKKEEVDELFRQNTSTFANINSLLEGASYPELENVTKGKSIQEMTVGLLGIRSTENLLWLQEWKRLAEAHYPGLDSSGASLDAIQQKLWQYLLFSEFVLDLPITLPASLSTVPCAPMEDKEIVFSICRKIRNSMDLREQYIQYANKVMDSLHLEDAFKNAKNLGNIVTFSFENSVEYESYIEEITSAHYPEAAIILKKNKNDVWYQSSKNVEAFWNLAEQVSELFDCIGKGIKGCGKFAGIVDWYVTHGYKADLAFRKFHTILQQLDYVTPQIKQLTTIVNDNYRDFTERCIKDYQQFVRADGLNSNPGIQKNINGFKQIQADLDAGKKVVMVMADAFRYEMGEDFAANLSASYEVECKPSFAFIPTVTRFGMAALLPKADQLMELKTVDGKLVPMFGEEVIVNPDDRVNYIKKNVSCKVYESQIDQFDTLDVPADARLLVIRSFAIDQAGENNNAKGFQLMAAEVKSFARLLEECRSLKFDVVYFFADHGYMMQSSYVAGSNMPLPSGTPVLTERRCVGGNINDSATTLSFTPAQMGIKSDVYKFGFAQYFGVFKAKCVYFHEGLSLQENIVPIVKVKLSKDVEQVKFDIKLTYKGQNEGTVYIQRPLIEININFEDLFGSDVHVKMDVKDIAGNEVGSVVESGFYNAVTKVISIPQNSMKVKQAIELNDGFSGDFVVSVLDAETNATLNKIKLTAEID